MPPQLLLVLLVLEHTLLLMILPVIPLFKFGMDIYLMVVMTCMIMGITFQLQAAMWAMLMLVLQLTILYLMQIMEKFIQTILV